MTSISRLILLCVVLCGLTSCGGKAPLEDVSWYGVFLLIWFVVTLLLAWSSGYNQGLVEGQEGHINSLRLVVANAAKRGGEG